MLSPVAVDYRSYLETAHWQELRKRTLWRFDFRCAVCNSAQFVEVHHRDYSRLGQERDTDVIVLCRRCHELFHSHGHLAG